MQDTKNDDLKKKTAKYNNKNKKSCVFECAKTMDIYN